MATTAAPAAAPRQQPRLAGRRRAILVGAVVVPVAAAAGTGYLLTRPEPVTPVLAVLELAPADTGAAVTLTLTAVRGRLPDRLTADLAAADPARVGSAVGSAPATRFGYSDLRLGGRRLSLHDAAYSVELVDLPAGGRSIRLSYRVEPVAGRRVVVLPDFRGTSRAQLTVEARGGRLRCTVTAPAPGPCRLDGDRVSVGSTTTNAATTAAATTGREQLRFELVTG